MASDSWKRNADTTKLSHEEIEKHDLHGAKRPPGKAPGGVLHQQGGAGLSRAGNYPVALAGLLVVAGIGTWAYYRSIHPQPGGSAGSHSPAVQKAQENSKAATQS